MKKIVWYLSALVLACALIVAGTGAKTAKAEETAGGGTQTAGEGTQNAGEGTQTAGEGTQTSGTTVGGILFSVDGSTPVDKTFGECAGEIKSSSNKHFTMTLCENITSDMINAASDTSKRYIELKNGNELTLDLGEYSIESSYNNSDIFIVKYGKLTVTASGGAIRHTDSGKNAVYVCEDYPNYGIAELKGGNYSRVAVVYSGKLRLSGGTYDTISRNEAYEGWTNIVESGYAMADGTGQLIGPKDCYSSTVSNMIIVPHGSNDHQPAGRYHTEDDRHSQVCAVCGECFDYESHTWNDGKCTVCGYSHANHTDADNNGFCDVCGRKHGVHTDADGNGVCDICGTTEFNFRDSNGVFYDSVQDAENAGTAGETIYLTLLRDISFTSPDPVDIYNCNFVIDMDGHKVTLTANYWLRPQSGSTVDLTIKNGTIEGGYYQIESYTTGTVTLDHITSSGSSRVISINNSSDIVISDCVLEGGSDYYILGYNNPAGNLTILRSRLNGKGGAVKFSSVDDSADSGVLIKDSEITAAGYCYALHAEGSPSQATYLVRIENSNLKSEKYSALWAQGTLLVEVTDSVIEKNGYGGSNSHESGAIYLHNDIVFKMTGGKVVNEGSQGYGIAGYASNVQIIGTEVSGTSGGLLLANIYNSSNIKLGGRFSSVVYETESDVTIGASLPEGTDVYEYDFATGEIGDKITDDVVNLKEITVPCIIRCSGEHSYDHGRCTVCGYEHTDHTFDGGTVAVAATYDAVGDKVYTCTVCGFERHEEIEKLVRSSYSSESYSAPAAPAAEKKEEGKKQEDKKEEKKESKEEKASKVKVTPVEEVTIKGVDELPELETVEATAKTADDGSKVFVDASGETVKKAVVKVTDDTGKEVKLYVNGKGQTVSNKIVKLEDGSKAFAKEDGTLASNEIVKAKNGKKYFVAENGVIVKNATIVIDGVKYKSNGKGVLKKAKKNKKNK